MRNHRFHSLGYVPFSWEKEPGRSNVNPQREEKGKEELQKAEKGKDSIKLPPPPCPTESPRNSGHGLYVPLPPCPFQPPQRSFSRKGSRKEDDPFMAAYMECTKSFEQQGKAVELPKEKKKRGVFGLGRSGGFGFSCKQSACEVIEDVVVIKRLSSFFSSS